MAREPPASSGLSSSAAALHSPPPQPPANWVPGAEGGPHPPQLRPVPGTTLHGRVPSRAGPAGRLQPRACITTCQVEQVPAAGWRGWAGPRVPAGPAVAAPGSPPAAPAGSSPVPAGTPRCGLQGPLFRGRGRSFAPDRDPRPSPAAGAGADRRLPRRGLHLLPPRLWPPAAGAAAELRAAGVGRTRVSNRRGGCFGSRASRPQLGWVLQAQSQQGNLEMGEGVGCGHHEVEGRDTVRWDKHLGPGLGQGGPAFIGSLSFSPSSRLAGHDPDPHPRDLPHAMKATGLARKVPRRWAQVSRLKGPMVGHRSL